MEKYVITITRQFGSLGRPIAQKLAEALKVEYYDRDIVEEAAKRIGESVKVVSQEEETVKNSFLKMRYPFGMNTTMIQDEIFQTQRKIIEEFASRQSCIIVGRCSDFILRDCPNSIHIFIYAPKEIRLKNCVEVLHMEENTARKTIAEVDRAREFYHKTYAGYVPEDMEHKNLLIDSSLLGVDGTALYLEQLVRAKNWAN